MVSSFALMTYYQYNLNIDRFSVLTTIIILCIILLVCTVILIIQAQKNISVERNIKNNENMITLTFVVVFGIVTLALISNYVSQILFAERTNLMINDANKLISVVENTNKENYVYMMDDIKNSGLSVSPFGNDYKANSYVTTFAKNNDVCLTDGKYSIIKNTNTKELELVKSDACDYELEEKDAELFINSKLFEKYNISFDVYNCKRNYDYDSEFNNKTGITCEIKYKDKAYSATIYDKKFELIDNFTVVDGI